MKRLVIPALFLVTLLASMGRARSWEAAPLVVHEWGVQVFDCAAGPATAPELPDFVYTDARPGNVAPLAGKPAKDYPPDSGIRMKPLLYFYFPTTPLNNPTTIPVGVDVRFATGHANAWWPQVNVYRTPAQTAAAKPIDWAAWRKQQPSRPFRSTTAPATPVPTDERFDLSWLALTLSADLPLGQTPAGEDLPADHWIQQARAPQSAYVSNGKECEKFLFYEGATRETPAVAVMPGQPWQGDRGQRSVVNVSSRPIYDVYAIYRSPAGVWVGRVSVLEPMRGPVADSSELPQQPVLRLPDFSKRDWPMMPAEFAARTTPRLIEDLTAGGAQARGMPMRDPADPQAPAATHTLFPDEAKSLERIWHDDFFESDGLTIVYRESPAALDEAMPLQIFTDMYHYIALSRCGLVVVRHVDAAACEPLSRQMMAYLSPSTDAATRDKALQAMRAHRLQSIGLARAELVTNRYRIKELQALIDGLSRQD